MTNKEALKLFKDHEYMTDFSFQDEMSEIAINSLKAWEEVLKELEILIRGCNIMLEDNNEDMFYGGKKRAYEKAIEIINQKLAVIDEQTQKETNNEFFNFDKVIEIEKNKSYQQGAEQFAEKIKSEIEKHWYRSELDMSADNVNSLIDDVLEEQLKKHE